MAEIVRLKHITRENDWYFFHYNGQEEVKSGVIELPADNETLIRRAWVLGFRLTEDGQPISNETLQDIIAQATVATDSQEEQDEQESNDSGGQPRSTDRVRESQSNSSSDVARSRPRGRVSSGSRKQGRKSADTAGSEPEVSASE